jgi:hypothetical protein
MFGACSVNGERSGVYRALVETCEEKRTFGKSRSRLVENIKVNLYEI